MSLPSVLVISYNVKDTLRTCLEALGREAEVIVVDNASPDGSAAMVRHEFPHAKLVPLEENQGFSAAVNAGARQATGDLLLVLNPDTALLPGTLERMAAAMQAEGRDDVWAMGFRQLDADGRFQLSFGPPPSLVLDFARRLVQLHLDAGGHWLGRLLAAATSRPLDMPWVSGAALLVRRQPFFEIGGFDERFFLYFEDIDFCLRLRQAGGRVLYEPSITVPHLRGKSAATAKALAARAYRESQLYFWEKHRGAWARALVAHYLRLRGLLPRD